jgi:sensor c-di-GMP phosphodiesterase-like protein
LRDAIETDVLRPFYQPLIDLSNGRITGFEALARWPRDGGFTPPSDFIPIDEQYG